MNTRAQTQAGGKTQNRLITAMALSVVAFFFVSTADAQSKIGVRPKDCGCSKTRVSEQYKLDKPGLLKAMFAGEYQKPSAASKFNLVGKRPKNLKYQKRVDNKVYQYWCYIIYTTWGRVMRCLYNTVYCDTFLDWGNVTYCYPYPDDW